MREVAPTIARRDESAECAIGVDAAIMGALLPVMEKAAVFGPLLQSLVSFDFVVDANIIAADLRYLAENPLVERTRLQEIAASGVIRFHIPHWALSELENSAIPEIARIHNVDEGAMLAGSNDYLRAFVIHDKYKWPAAAILGSADARDEPYAALARDICANGVLSRDKDIEEFGACRIDIDELIVSRLYVRAKAATLSMQVVGVSVTGLSFWAVIQVAQWLWRSVVQMPTAFKLSIGAGLLLVFTSRQFRTLVQDLIPVGRVVAEAIQNGFDYTLEHQAYADQKLAELQASIGATST